MKVTLVISLVRKFFQNEAERNLAKSWCGRKEIVDRGHRNPREHSLASNYKKDCVVDSVIDSLKSMSHHLMSGSVMGMVILI